MSESKRSWMITGAVGAFLLWCGWVSASMISHGVAIAELSKWQQNRPHFVTRDEVDLAVLQSERELQEKLSAKLDAILVAVTTLDKRFAEHIAETKSKNP